MAARERQILRINPGPNDRNPIFKLLEESGWEIDDSGDTDELRFEKIGNHSDADDMRSAILEKYPRMVWVEILAPVQVRELTPTDFDFGRP